ncbi:MAG: oxygenase MpaB family protein [Gammaproteobacteria bacterium]
MSEQARCEPQQIVRRIVCYEFPFDFTRALEFALFRTFCVPSISRLLNSSGEFIRRAQKRYDDTDLLVSEILEHGYESERGRAAIERINAIHGRFRIANDDFLYVLSSFIYEPIRWIARFAWRPMQERERLALFYFWREVGHRMHIHSIPRDYHEFEQFNSDYERRHFRYTETNRRVGTATREMFAAWFPWLPRPLVRRVIHALLDDTLIEAFGFPRPSRIMRGLVTGSLRLRGRLSGWLPVRQQPRLRTELIHRSYPAGYEIGRLGPRAGHQ